jgi:hypothetical protein
VFANPHCEDVATGTVQYTVGGGTHQQGQAVAPMAANDYKVCAEFLRSGVNFNFRTAQNNMLVLLIDTVGLGELLELLGGLLMDLVLDSGKVHGDIAAVSETQWLDYMDQVQRGAVVGGYCPGALGYLRGVLAEVYGDQDLPVF